MEKEICGYIYKITNTVNGKVYIGLTTNNFNKRYSAKGEGIERVYNYYLQRIKKEQFYNKHLLNSIEKYGFEAFEVIKEFDTAYSIEELKEKERYWVSFYKSNDANYGYNRTEGGEEHPNYGKPCSEETKNKISKSHRGLHIGENNPMYGKHHTEEAKNKISEINTGRHPTEETKNKMSESHRGKSNSSYKGFVVIYPNGEVSKEMTRDEVVNYLGVGNSIIADLAKEKTCYIGRHKHIRYVRVLHLEDYLKERELYKNDEDFKSMCKHMVEEAEKRLSEAKKETLICIFPSGKIIKDICVEGLVKELGISRKLVVKILRSHKPYKAPNRSDCKHLERLNGVIIMEEKDYLNTIENQNINDDKAS